MLVFLVLAAQYESFRLPLAIILVVPLCLLFAIAAGLIVARLSVFYRDIPHLLGVAFGLIFWFTPIVYHWSFLPESIEIIAKNNPFALLVSLNQVVWHGQRFPSMTLIAASAVVVAITFYMEHWSRGLERRLPYSL